MRRAVLIAAALGLLGGSGLGGAAPLSSPTASTGPVSNVAGTSATVTGSVNPGGETTTWYVEYGTTTSYGKKTSNASASGSSTISISVDLSGLTPATTYHYRVTATNASGTGHGSDGIVTTLPAPAVSASDADEISPSQARLHGTLNPNGLATSWFFEYGKTAGYGSKTSTQNAGSGTSSQNVSALVTNLSAGTTYHFRLVATSDGGTSRTPDRTFPTSAPPTVKTGSASSLTTSSAVVAGTINPQGRTSTVWFEYGTSTSYGAKTSEQNAGNGTSDRSASASLTGLKAGTTYHFRIVGKSDAGTVAGSDASFQTTAAPTATTKAATGIGGDRATLNADVNPQGRSTTWYFEYGTSTSYGSKTSSRNAGSGTSTVAVTADAGRLRAASAYHFRIVAVNSAGTTRGADMSFVTLGPPNVQRGVVTQLSTASAVVSGRVNPLGLAATYWFEYGRTTAYGLRTATVGLQTGTGDVAVSAPLAGLTPGVRYHFRLVAQTSGGTSTGTDASFGTSPLPRGPNGRPVLCTIVGTVGPDVLRGTSGPDVICGLGGGDVIRGLGGNDVIYGGPGDDVVDGGSGNDALYGGTGNDRLLGGTDADRLDGGPGRDVLLAGPGRDTLLARDRVRDVVNGGPGRDRGRIDRGRDRRVSVEALLA